MRQPFRLSKTYFLRVFYKSIHSLEAAIKDKKSCSRNEHCKGCSFSNKVKIAI